MQHFSGAIYLNHSEFNTNILKNAILLVHVPVIFGIVQFIYLVLLLFMKWNVARE